MHACLAEAAHIAIEESWLTVMAMRLNRNVATEYFIQLDFSIVGQQFKIVLKQTTELFGSTHAVKQQVVIVQWSFDDEGVIRLSGL